METRYQRVAREQVERQAARKAARDAVYKANGSCLPQAAALGAGDSKRKEVFKYVGQVK